MILAIIREATLRRRLEQWGIVKIGQTRDVGVQTDLSLLPHYSGPAEWNGMEIRRES